MKDLPPLAGWPGQTSLVYEPKRAHKKKKRSHSRLSKKRGKSK